MEDGDLHWADVAGGHSLPLDNAVQGLAHGLWVLSPPYTAVWCHR